MLRNAKRQIPHRPSSSHRNMPIHGSWLSAGYHGICQVMEVAFPRAIMDWSYSLFILCHGAPGLFHNDWFWLKLSYSVDILMVSATIHPVSVDIRQVPTSVTGALQGLRQWQRWQRTHNFPSWQRLEGLPKWVSNWTLGNVGCVPLRIDTGNQQALETQENPMATVPFCVGRISDSLEFLALKSLCRLNSKWFPKYSHQFACWIPMTRGIPNTGRMSQFCADPPCHYCLWRSRAQMATSWLEKVSCLPKTYRRLLKFWFKPKNWRFVFSGF
jgi:hypothetical protein